ncbi:MAG: hypothetical protein EZS28_008175 [Streblomastix strix]|uniref:Uncharacterized protein n=1 Tax=Streblomastix strix TaxID=222440 RepID=A0A5J4WN33_9EUKA|nr:MAG: hypothetical protein EZS28_008175 [Streblomastix strix]
MEPIGACLMNHLDAWRKIVAEELVKQESNYRIETRIITLDKPNFRKTKEREWTLEENHGLLGVKQAPCILSLQDGRYTNSEITSKELRLGYQNRSRISIQPCPNKSQPVEVSWFPVQRQVLFVPRNVLWYQERSFSLPQTDETRNAVHKDHYKSGVFHTQTIQSSYNNSEEDFQQQIPKILEILTDLGWKVSRGKSILTPQQQIEFLGWKVDLKNNQLSMTKERRAETLYLLGKWRRTIEKNQIVRIKWVASLIGKLNFLRTQFRRGQPEAVLTTDTSETQQGGTLQLIKTGQTVRFAGNWYNNLKWKLTSSIQRELAAIIFGIQSIGKNFEVGAIKSLRIQSDNSTAIFDLRRGAAALALCKLVDQILQTLENRKIQFSAFHIPGKDKKEVDSHLRLSTSGDYGIRTEVLDEALQELAMQPTVDYFAIRRNRKCRRFYSLIWDPWARGQD